MKNFLSNGNDLAFTAPAGGVVSGGGYIIGSLFVVAATTAAAGEKFVGRPKGEYEFDAEAAEVISEGDELYWDLADQKAKLDDESGANELIGVASSDKVNGGLKVSVRLNGVSLG